MKSFLKTLMVLLVVFPHTVHADHFNLEPGFADKVAGNVVPLAKQYLWSGEVVLDDGEAMDTPPEGEDKTIGYTTDEDAYKVVYYAILNANADICRMDWRSHYNALLDKAQGRYNKYQIAYIRILHTLGMESITRANTNMEVCDHARRGRLQKQLFENLKQF